MRVPEPPVEDGSTPDSNLCRLNQVEAEDASALAPVLETAFVSEVCRDLSSFPSKEALISAPPAALDAPTPQPAEVGGHEEDGG